MLNLRHAGIYVKDLVRMAAFYRDVFQMHTICENVEQSDELIADLFQVKEAKVRLTKLITEQGKASGVGDMLELLQLLEPEGKALAEDGPISEGMHVAFGVRAIEMVVDAIVARGGKRMTRIHLMGNGNKCCFCRDPEGNWLELIEVQGRKEQDG